MNEVLFKKLNEKVELVSIKNSINITEADEYNLIFNGFSFNDILKEDGYGSKRYWLYKNGEYTEPKHEEEKPDQPDPRIELKKKQESYDAAFEKLDYQATECFEEIRDLREVLKFKKDIYTSTKTSDSEKEDIKADIEDVKNDLKIAISTGERLRKELENLNFGDKTPSGVSRKNSFTKLTRAFLTSAKYGGI